MGRQNMSVSATSHEDHCHRRLQVLFTRKMHERQIFMEDLKGHRKFKDARILKNIKKTIGPSWYQVLSAPQRFALDNLKSAMYKDLLEGSPTRTSRVLQNLGICPLPHAVDIMNCNYLGRNDPKEMLAQLFMLAYDHPIHNKRSSYSLNGKLMLSAILYLGLEEIKSLLKERFQPDEDETRAAPKIKTKIETSCKSPYLQELKVPLYYPSKSKRPPPPPLPKDLEELNEPWTPPPPVPKPSPPPPPPPPPKKRLPRGFCDQVAGFVSTEPLATGKPAPPTKASILRPTTQRKFKGSKMNLADMKQMLNKSNQMKPKKKRMKKPHIPKTGLENMQYVINGVNVVNNKAVFSVAGVSNIPVKGEIIHGGHALVDGTFINVHRGIQANLPPPKPLPCDCVKKWNDTAFKYVESTKCRCGHYYDFGHDEGVPPDDCIYFTKPTKGGPHGFDYGSIYETNPQVLLVQKEVKKVYDTESMLQVPLADGTLPPPKKKEKKKKKASKTCLGTNPKPSDYLKCALRIMGSVTIAAQLPDVHLVPELKEWMRRRLLGPYSLSQRQKLLRKSTNYWAFVKRLEAHISPPKSQLFSQITTWRRKPNLGKKFQKYIYEYKVRMFRMHAKLNNLLWATMCQAQFPDKKFREIFFSYLIAKVEDIQLMHPYCSREAADRQLILAVHHRSCIRHASVTQI